jgi:hypothetical protein
MGVLPSEQYSHSPNGAPSIHIGILLHTNWLLQEKQLPNA